jgi:hypothetical protein
MTVLDALQMGDRIGRPSAAPEIRHRQRAYGSNLTQENLPTLNDFEPILGTVKERPLESDSMGLP